MGRVPGVRTLVQAIWVALVVAAVAGCGRVDTSATSATSENSAVVINTGSWKPGSDSMLALVGGTLRINDEGCVYLGTGPDDTAEPGGPARDVVWPAGYTAEQLESGNVVVKRPDGQVVAKTGHDFRTGGGAVPMDDDSQMSCRAGTGDVVFVQQVLPPLDSN